MKELYTDIEIDAPAEPVWKILIDFAAYPQWNPFIRQISGEIKEGARLKVYFEPSGGRGIIMRPQLIRVEPERELRWQGHLWLPGLFDGQHIFKIEPLAENRVRFIQRELFSGLLTSFLSASLDKNTRRGFEEMNLALKVRAEHLFEQQLRPDKTTEPGDLVDETSWESFPASDPPAWTSGR